MEKVNDLIRDQLSQAISRELSLKPEVLVSITKVKTSADLSQSSVLVSIFPLQEAPYCLATLKKEAPLLKKKLAKKLKLRKIPCLKFVHDQTGEKISQLEELFEKIKSEKTNESS